MRNSRLGFLIATLVLSGVGTACKRGRADTGPDPNTRPPPWSWGGDHKADHFQPLVERPKIDPAPTDADRRQAALKVFRSATLGLLHESSKEELKKDSDAARAALTDTIRMLPESLRRTFGPKVAERLSKDFEFRRTVDDPKVTDDRSNDSASPKVECAHSACFVDVYFQNWPTYDGLNQFLAIDTTLPWNKYPATQYRSGRAEIKNDPRKGFVVTWALVFPLKTIKEELAEKASADAKKEGVVQ